jgi:hypothetical protein
MSLLDDLRRGFETGRAAAGARPARARRDAGIAGGFGDGELREVATQDLRRLADLAGDELDKSKAVIAGLREENGTLKAQMEQSTAALTERDEFIAKLHVERDRASAQLRALESVIASAGAAGACPSDESKAVIAGLLEENTGLKTQVGVTP